MITAVPAALPRTRPVLFTEATAGLPLLQLPPETVGVIVVVVPGHMMVLPESDPALGNGFTANTRVATPVPQLPETV